MKYHDDRNIVPFNGMLVAFCPFGRLTRRKGKEDPVTVKFVAERPKIKITSRHSANKISHNWPRN